MQIALAILCDMIIDLFTILFERAKRCGSSDHNKVQFIIYHWLLQNAHQNSPGLDRKLEHLEKTVAELREQVTRQQHQQQQQPQQPQQPHHHQRQQQQQQQPAEPRAGWSSPDYAKLLAAKRRQEAMRRRLEDPELFVRQDATEERQRQLEVRFLRNRKGLLERLKAC